MVCKKCSENIPENSKFCNFCGYDQSKTPRTQNTKSRGNGQGSVYKTASGKWTAAKVFGYIKDDNGKLVPIKATKGGFTRKKDALDYLPQLTKAPQHINKHITFKSLYDLWLPYHEAKGKSKSTINCYKAAMKHYKDIWFMRFCDIGIDDLQECIDDCPHGKRTRQNMKALGTLLYSYAIPRGYCPDKVDLAHYLFISGDSGTPREAFTNKEIEIIKSHIGQVPYADYIYCHIYLGFRPHEFLTLDIENYDAKEHCFIGGGKTEAGTNRTVTISPKIQPIIKKIVGDRTSGPVFCGPDGNEIYDKKYREECFYPALKAMGLPNPEYGMNGPRKLTPHCCRHTFATLMKNINGTDKDKLALMGHTSTEMLQHYQHVNLEDLRIITDNL